MTRSFLDLDVSELFDLSEDLTEFADKLRPAANRATLATANYVAALAESSVARLTGDLAGSIKVDKRGAGKNQAHRVYADDDAAMANEYGTSRQAPQPFLMVHHTAGLSALEAALVEELEALKL